MQISNTIFFGCNYNDRRIKAQFDSLKKRIEGDTALACVVVDKRAGKSARDLWQDIKTNIEQSAACVFDVTGFRPNVVLELGYALSIKSEDQVFITFRKRKTRGKAPTWLLSDISHLQRHDYVNIGALERHVREQLDLIPFSVAFRSFQTAYDTTNAADKYREFGLKILRNLRDEGPRSKQQVQAVMAGSACRWTQMTGLLKRHKLVRRGVGRHGKFSITQTES